MNITKKLLGVSALLGMIIFSASQLSAQRTTDEGKNFTVSDSPETTVFNLRTPSVNRHILDYSRRAGATPAPAQQAPRAPVDCESGSVTDYVDQYLVRLDKTAPATVALNAPFDYNYTVTAKDKVKRVVVEEQIPQGATYVSSVPEAEVSGNTVTWNIYNLEKGQSVPLTLTVEPTEVADLSSCATITAFPQACTTTTVGVPELAVTKSTPNERVLMDAGVPWTIRVTNTGNFCAYDVVLTDTLPAGLTHESGNRTLTAEIGTLAPGESREVTVNTTAVAAGEHINNVSVNASNAASAESQAGVFVVLAGLEVAKTGPELEFVGKQVAYTITVTNTGEVDLQDVVVTDTVPAQNRLLSAPGAQVDGNTATWTTNLAAGQSREFQLTVLGLEAGTFCNQVAAQSAAYELSVHDDACTEWRGHPALLMEVIDTEDPLLIGQETTYVIQITNQGTAPDHNVRLEATVPPELEIVRASGDTEGRIDGRQISFAPYEVLQAKEIIQYRVVARAVAEGDARFRAQMQSDLIRTPVPQEESTQVY